MSDPGVPGGTAIAAPATAPPEAEFDPADFVTRLHDDGLWPINAGGDPQVPDKTTAEESEDNHLKAYQI